MESFTESEVPNPFTFKLQLRWYRIPQIAFMTVVVVPIKVTLVILLNVLAWIIACGTLYGLTDEELSTRPLSGWRRKSRSMVYSLGTASIFCGGSTFAKIIGRQANPEDAPILVLAPHSTPLDCNAIFLMDECSMVAAEEVSSLPIIGKLLKLTQPVLVNREDKNSKYSATPELTRRANSNGLWPASFLFPEGTTTNRKALIPFKRGAFVAGKPVQPVTLKYTDMWDTVTWTWLGGPPFWVMWWLSMCKFNMGLTLEFLPVYYPSVDEQKNPELYAENVRQSMALSLNVPCSPLTRADARRMAKEASERVRNKTK